MSDLSDSEERADIETWEDWEDDESGMVISLFSDDTFPSVDEALAFDAANHGFNLIDRIKKTGATFYDTLKLINYIRAEVLEGRNPCEKLQSNISLEGPWQDDKYLQPVLANDELLLHDWDGELEGPDGTTTSHSGDAIATAPVDIEDEDLSALLQEMRALAANDASVRDLLATSTQQQQQQQHQEGNDASLSRVSSEQRPDEEETARIDDNYFESYSFFDIHREMLSDRVRTEAYRRALEHNPSLIQGATVLDVGCGTGVLSMFAARGGAAKVVAVDGSRRIADVARDICAANGFGGGQEGPVTVLASRVERLQALPVDSDDGKVDVLVSEWMGYALLFESMLDSVLLARDRFLRPGGAVLPDVARIMVAAAGEGATGIDFWKDVYGIRMDNVAAALRQTALHQGVVRVVDPKHLLTEGHLIHSLDLSTMTAEDQDFTAEFDLPATKTEECHALVVWFDALFSQRFCKDAPQELPTGPNATPTHWAQAVLVLPEPVNLAAGGIMGEAAGLRGRLSMARRAGRHRTLDISVEYAPVDADGHAMGESRVQMYTMGVSS